jgi:ribosome-associated protein
MPASQSVKNLAQIAADAISEKLGKDILAIDLSDQMVLSEVFLITTGQNPKQVDAIADFVEEKMRIAGEKPARREKSEEWILLDYSDLVVHIQSENLRSYYMLDRLWNDCPIIKLKVDDHR